jgi:phosphoheptose isomerase
MNRSIVDMENLSLKFDEIINSQEWLSLEKDFKETNNVFVLGNGGNLSVADHAAIDITRLTDKKAICPGSGITATSIIGDNSFEVWFQKWVEYNMRFLNPKDITLIAFSCSTTGASSSSLLRALEWAADRGGRCHMICAREKSLKPARINFINQDVVYYHTSEVISTMMFYQLIHCAGFECPSILKKARARSKNVEVMEGR